MAVIRNKNNGTWEVRCYYKDFYGELKQKTKRGFKRKCDAVAWENDFKSQKDLSLDMPFGRFVEIYLADIKPRLKYNTYLTKENIISSKILPYFEKMKLKSIKASDVIGWQNKLMEWRDSNENGYSSTYLKTIHNQLSAILNHAVNMYGLNSNVARKVGHMGSKKTDKEMLFWTKEEFLKFVDAIADKPVSYYAFEILYWCGIRVGELLALTQEDLDFSKQTLRINKSYQRLNGEDYITPPKTPKSNRIITIPKFLCLELENYFNMLYEYSSNDRVFQISKGYLHAEMDRGVKISGVKRIRIHDLRHSHVSLLIDMGFSAVAIGERVGHESIDITYRYAHLFPSVQQEMANKLDEVMRDVDCKS